MSDLKDQLIRLGAQQPKLRPHLRPILASLSPKMAWSSFKFKEDRKWNDLVEYELEDILDDMESDFEAYAPSVTNMRPHSKRGTVVVAWGTIISTGGQFNAISDILTKAEEQSYKDAKEHWIKNNQDVIQQHGLRPDQINYNDLYDLDLGHEAEQLSEVEMEIHNEETLYANIYVDVEPARGNDDQVKVTVHGIWDSDGYYLQALQRGKTVFRESFTAPRDLSSSQAEREAETKLQKMLQMCKKALD